VELITPHSDPDVFGYTVGFQACQLYVCDQFFNYVILACHGPASFKGAFGLTYSAFERDGCALFYLQHKLLSEVGLLYPGLWGELKACAIRSHGPRSSTRERAAMHDLLEDVEFWHCRVFGSASAEQCQVPGLEKTLPRRRTRALGAAGTSERPSKPLARA
jgi:hypothetical protein